MSFIGWPYDDSHQATDDLALIDHELVAFLSGVSYAVTRSLVTSDSA